MLFHPGAGAAFPMGSTQKNLWSHQGESADVCKYACGCWDQGGLALQTLWCWMFITSGFLGKPWSLGSLTEHIWSAACCMSLRILVFFAYAHPLHLHVFHNEPTVKQSVCVLQPSVAFSVLKLDIGSPCIQVESSDSYLGAFFNNMYSHNFTWDC